MARQQKRRNRIGEDQALAIFKAYALSARKFNFYQIRIRSPHSDQTWDWYHTTGTLVCTAPEWVRNVGSFADPEDCAIFINRGIIS